MLAEALDTQVWAETLGISREAVELYRASDVIDLHLDSYIWQRVFGRDLAREWKRPPLGGWFLGHADFRRVRRAALSGATWVVTTNPLRDASERFAVLLDNLQRLSAELGRFPDDLRLVRTLSEYEQARADGVHAAFIGIQGGNALDGADDAVERLPRELVLRVTLIHLSNSRIGQTSSPLRLGPDAGLSAFGRSLVERLEAANIFIDLAHASAAAFWDALAVHDRSRPVLVTHTGVSGVHRHWRNLDDAQLRAVANSGGVVGVMFHSSFLGDPLWAGRAESVVDHLQHVVRVAGEDVPALGSDFDGAIVPPRDLKSVLELPRLVEIMLKRGFSSERIQNVLGRNFLRVLGRVRP